MNDHQSLRNLVLASLMAALISVGGYMAIPIGPVPIVLQNLFVLVAALLLGSKWAAASVAVYLVAGACGLPVFATGGGGLGHLLGPRGGYLFGFLACAWIAGLISEHFKQRPIPEIIAMVVGSLVIYAIGVPWLKFVLGLSFSKAAVLGMYPFLVGDALKIVAAAFIVKSIRPLLGFSRTPVHANL